MSFVELTESISASGRLVPQARPERVELISPTLRQKFIGSRRFDRSESGLEASQAVGSDGELILQGVRGVAVLLNELRQARTRSDEAAEGFGGGVDGGLDALAWPPARLHSAKLKLVGPVARVVVMGTRGEAFDDNRGVVSLSLALPTDSAGGG